WTLVAMQLSSVLLDAPILHLTARWPRRELLAGSLAAVAASCVAAACVPSYAGLLGVLFVFGLSIGIACAIAEAALVDLAPEELGASSGERSVVLAAGTLGAIGGLAAAEWAWSRIEPLRLLLVCAPASAVALAVWPAAHWLPLSAVLLAVTCALAAPLYAVVS